MSKITLVSACMLEIPCKYSATCASKRLPEEIIKHLDLIIVPICPEQLGGLCTPRSEAQIVGGTGMDVINGIAKVMTHDGQNVTKQYLKGAEIACKIADISHATMAIVKARSPSCSKYEIYDGSFSQIRIPGMGVATAMLSIKTKLEIFDLDDIENLYQ
ncbi:MAG: DUF523 domain-containing protein [Anaerolineaceae bacterium]|nr:DUF523 domain-containing protein [Anaerolineaceae bacterium]